MKRTNRIGGFGVDYVESVRNGRVWFTARIVDPHIYGIASATPEEAFSSLALKWEAVKAAYRNSNLPIPKPVRNRSNQHALATLRWLASRPPLSKDIL